MRSPSLARLAAFLTLWTKDSRRNSCCKNLRRITLGRNPTLYTFHRTRRSRQSRIVSVSSQRPKLGRLEVARFVNPQFSTLIGAPRDSKVQTIVFPNLPIISTGACANLAGDLCDAFVVIGIDLLVNENETFSTGNVNPLTSGVVCHVIRVGGTGQTGM